MLCRHISCVRINEAFPQLLVAPPPWPSGHRRQCCRAEHQRRFDYAASADQVTSVTQFSDVYPTDWAYQALAGLVETYGCVVGYPNGTFRGNQP